MRPAATTLALLAVLALLASCGKGQSVVTRTVTTQGTAPPSAHSEGSGGKSKGAKAKALAFARAVNLRAADVPGFSSRAREKERTTPAERRAGHELQRCLGRAPEAGPLAEHSSPSFQRGGTSIAEQSVSSEVTIARSAAVAAKEVSEISSAHARSCFTHYLDQLFSGLDSGGLTVGPISIAHGTPPAPPGGASFGLRATAALIVRSVHIPFYLDILGFIQGAREVTLQTTGVPAPFPAASEQQLYSLLLERAKAHASEAP
jgi:hypothetical protein